MSLNSIDAIFNSMTVKGVIDFEQGSSAKKGNSLNFGSVLKNAISEINKQQLESENLKRKLAMGEVQNIHEVPIAAEKAMLSLQAAMAIRGKVVEAYKEILRIQL